MSYVEHGSRLFSANNQQPGLVSMGYGDCVLPRKRSEGRLKVYESCTDVRAWSLNPLEAAQYLKELTQNPTKPPDAVDAIIGLGTKTEVELRNLRFELDKYRSLELTPQQQLQLRDYGSVTRSRSKSLSRVQFDYEATTTTPSTKISTEKFESVDDESERPIISSNVGSEKSEPTIDDSRVVKSSSRFNSDKSEVTLTSTVKQMGGKIFDSQSSSCESDEELVTETTLYSSPAEKKFLDIDDSKDTLSTSDLDRFMAKEAEIVALRLELQVRESEIEELRELNELQELKIGQLMCKIEDKDDHIEELKENLMIHEKQLMGMGDQQMKISTYRHKLLETEREASKMNSYYEKLSLQYKSDLNTSKNQINRLKDENKQLKLQMSELFKEAEVASEAAQLLKREHEELLDLRVQCQDQEAENQKLLDKIGQICGYYKSSEKQLKATIKQLESTIEEKESVINNYEHRLSNVNCHQMVDINEEQRKLLSFDVKKLCVECKDTFQRQKNLSSVIQAVYQGLQKLVARLDHPDDKLTEEKMHLKPTIEQLKAHLHRLDDWTLEVIGFELILSGAAQSMIKLHKLSSDLQSFHEDREGLLKERNDLKKRIHAMEHAIFTKDQIVTNRLFEEAHEKHKREADECKRYIEKLKLECEQVISTAAESRSVVDDDRHRSSDEKIDRAIAVTFRRSLDKMNQLSAALRGAGGAKAIAQKEKCELEKKYSEHHIEHSRKLKQLEVEFKRLSERLKNRDLEFDEARESWKLEKDKLETEKQREIDRVSREGETRIGSLTSDNASLRKKIGDIETSVEKLKKERVAMAQEKERLKMEVEELRKKCNELNDLGISLKSTEKHEMLECLKQETEKFDKNRERLYRKLETLNLQLVHHENLNKQLECNFQSVKVENEQFVENIKIYERHNKLLTSQLISATSGQSFKKVADKIFEKLLGELEDLRSQIHKPTSDLRIKSVKSIAEFTKDKDNEMNSLKSKLVKMEREGESFKEALEKTSRENKNLIENLEREKAEKKSLCDRLSMKSMEKSQSDHQMGKISEMTLKMNDLEEDCRSKHGEIKRLTAELNLKVTEIKRLEVEKEKLQEKLKINEKQYKLSLANMKIFYEDQKKNFMDKHNQSIRRLQMQHEEYLKSNGIPLNRDDWLKSLDVNELLNVHKTIMALVSSDTSEKEKLEFDGKLHSPRDIEAEARRQYMIERFREQQQSLVAKKLSEPTHQPNSPGKLSSRSKRSCPAMGDTAKDSSTKNHRVAVSSKTWKFGSTGFEPKSHSIESPPEDKRVHQRV